jgi:transcriptional regulator with PAS, ATPase and Fis domain
MKKPVTLKKAHQEWEKKFILKALNRNRKWGQIIKTAEELDIHRNHLLYKIKAYRLRQYLFNRRK